MATWRRGDVSHAASLLPLGEGRKRYVRGGRPRNGEAYIYFSLSPWPATYSPDFAGLQLVRA